MQFTPLETHLTPVIAVEQDKLDVNKESVHYFNLQTLDVVAGVVEVAFVVVVLKFKLRQFLKHNQLRLGMIHK